MTFTGESHPMDPLGPVIEPELLDELLKLTKEPKALFGAQGWSSSSKER
jgi:hypothetical protein